MKLTTLNNKAIWTLALAVFGFVALGQVNQLQAGSDKEQVVVEGVDESDPIDVTVFIPKESPTGSYVLNGVLVPIPVGTSVHIPTGATQISIPGQTIVTIVQTPTNQRPITRTYVTTTPTVITTQTVNGVPDTGIVIIGTNSDLPPERNVSNAPGEDATDSNN